ncbi:MAG: molecular chaperone HtpG [Chitinivibrionales bacterium]|nr:molecular chaperone HtpG [Chitinivibrionales bacterium]
MAKTADLESREFQTEAKQLLHLMIHSLYTHKEVFVRELISNASDALDKLRFESLTDKEIMGKDTTLDIHIKLDKKAKIFTISDNGIGMSREEVVENIGTIARSGSKALLEKMSDKEKLDSNLIGQFGVGFYSVFMVASKVKLVTKRAGDQGPATVWESDGENAYAIGETQKPGRGTEITVYLKEEEAEYAEDWKIKSIVKKYSDFIAFPIYLPDDKGKEEIINETKPIWKREPADVTDDQYEVFYKHSLNGFEKPLKIIHKKAEGLLEYSYLMFIPEKAPFDLFNFERKHGVKLYVKRVFIMDDCKELLPEYLRFIKGVVDSEDLPLNVSRETLQQNPIVEKMKKNLVGKVVGALKELSDTRPDEYKKFWTQFGAVLKEGIHSDYENKDKLLEIVRFQSSNAATAEEVTSLKQYVERMRTDQKDIYYIAGESRDIVEKSPHLEVFRDKGIEVLYLVDPIDEFIVHDIYNFDGKQLKSVTQGDLDLGELGKEEKEEKEKAESSYKKLTERIKNILGDEVKEVRVTTRLKDSPCCLVAEDGGMSAHMEKIMKSMGQTVNPTKRIMEINAEHSILRNMNRLYEKDPKDTQLEEWVKLLYDQAIVSEGQVPKDPLAYAQRVNELLVRISSACVKD